jgi:acetyl esterase/lipase
MDIAARTDDAHRALLDVLPPTLFDLSDLDSSVALLNSMFAAPVEIPASVVTHDHLVVGDDGHEVLVRLYRPRDATSARPALYWIHGGGLVLGNVGMDDLRCADLVEQLGIVVASVEYRLAPAFPYPTPLEDCAAGLAWLFAKAETLAIDATRVAIGGGSAGAGLAAALALRLRDAGGRQPCFQLLRYPMIDDRHVTASSHEVTDGRVWNRSSNMAGWSAYLGTAAGSAEVSPYAAPSRAVDLSGLPPAIVTVGELDLFLDEDIDYAQRLIAAGVSTELHVYPHCIHGSDAMLPEADVVKRWQRDEADALRRALFGYPADGC